MANAAANLTAALQGGLGHSNNYGYNGLTINQLRANPTVSAVGNANLATAIRDVPPLNPQSTQNLGPMSQHSGEQVINSVDELFRATTVSKQLRAYEFASTGQFPYRSALKADNCNAIAFAYGSFKHLYAVKSGLLSMSDDEFLARLKHLKNVFEIACMSSPLNSFCDPPWQIAREYDSRVVSDIESGVKSWCSLANGLESDAMYVAKETVELRNKKLKPNKPKKEGDRPKSDPKKPVAPHLTPIVHPTGAFGNIETKASPVFSNTIVRGAKLTVMSKKNTNQLIASINLLLNSNQRQLSLLIKAVNL